MNSTLSYKAVAKSKRIKVIFSLILIILASLIVSPDNVLSAKSLKPTGSKSVQLQTSTEIPQSKSEFAELARKYIAETRSIPYESLLVLDDHSTEYPNLDRKFHAIVLLDTRKDGGTYKLLVDILNNQIEEDVSALLKAEDKARMARYGKLEPALDERLQNLRNDENVTVAVWMTDNSGATFFDRQQSAFSVVADKYAPAKIASERGDKPMDVVDQALAKQIYADYAEIMREATNRRVQPLMSDLAQLGFVPQQSEDMPALDITLP